jgi:hypothetical protein
MYVALFLGLESRRELSAQRRAGGASARDSNPMLTLRTMPRTSQGSSLWRHFGRPKESSQARPAAVMESVYKLSALSSTVRKGNRGSHTCSQEQVWRVAAAGHRQEERQ